MYIAMHIEQYPADLFSRSPLISITGSKQSGKSDDINYKSKIDCQTWKALLSGSILKLPGPPTTFRYIWEASWKIPNK